MLKLRKTSFVLLLLAVVLVAMNSVVFAQESVKIGVMGPFTGPAASIGQEQLNWAKLAVSDFNSATGMNVELVEGDTQLNPAIAVTVAESLIADPEIYGIVGPAGSQEVAAIGQQLTDAGLAFISGSATDPAMTQSGFSFFRSVPTDAVQGPTDAQFLYDLGITSVYVLDDQSSYAVGLADSMSAAFEALGGTIANRESVTQQDTDFSSLVTVIDSSGAGAVFFVGQIASQGALFAQQMVEQDVDFILMGADGFQSGDFVGDAAAGATDGAYVSSFAPDIHSLESAADTIARYTEAYGDFTTTFGPPVYAATMAVLDAIKVTSDAGNLNREAVRDAMSLTDQQPSVMGTPLSFDENGDVLGASFYIFQVQDGTFVYLPQEAASEATPEASS